MTGPTEETPCVQAGLAAVAVAMTTIAMTALIKRSRSSLANDCLAITADPLFAALRHRCNNASDHTRVTSSRQASAVNLNHFERITEG